MIQLRGFLGKLLGPLLKTGLPLIKKVIKPLAKSLLIPLGLTAAASAADTGIQKKILGSGENRPSSTTLIISNNERDDIIKIIKSLEDSDLLLKGVTETVQNEIKEGAGEGATKSKRQGKGLLRAGYGNKKGQKNNKTDF